MKKDSAVPQHSAALPQTARVVIVGAGIAGLSAAIHLAEKGVPSLLVAPDFSERSQSVMAEGGINGAINTMGEDDSPSLHAAETLKAGRFLADPLAVEEMTAAAPALIQRLFENGMCLDETADHRIALRSFGGQSKKRTAHAKASTGKQLMHTLISMARRYEAERLIDRRTGWHFLGVETDKARVVGIRLYHRVSGTTCTVSTPAVIVATGGMNGLFGNATGSVQNEGNVTAALFAQGVELANAEMVQYHPTTVRLHGKNMLITEAVRGEGGRLFAVKDDANSTALGAGTALAGNDSLSTNGTALAGNSSPSTSNTALAGAGADPPPPNTPYYFMEDRYPEQKNLAPRDVISREEWKLQQEGYRIFLDMRHLAPELIQTKLPGVARDMREYLSLDVTKDPIPVEPGIHYFMGGIRVDRAHRTSLSGLYAAGECACQYHGANRLGGNSLLGALYGGMRTALTVAAELPALESASAGVGNLSSLGAGTAFGGAEGTPLAGAASNTSNTAPGGAPAPDSALGEPTLHLPTRTKELQAIMRRAMGIARVAATLQEGLAALDALEAATAHTYDPTAPRDENLAFQHKLLLGKALVQSALAREESRGAHYRLDFPAESDAYKKTTVASYHEGAVSVRFAPIDETFPTKEPL